MNQKSNAWKLVGKIKDAQGLKGEVYVLIFSGEMEWKSKLRSILLSTEETPEQGQEFEVTKAQNHKTGLILKLKGIENRNQSEELKGKLLFISSEHFVSKKGERIFLNEILGFQVFDGDRAVGEIVQFSSNGPQDLLVIEQNQKKYDIPFVEAFLVEIDFKNRIVKMNLPEGLLD